MVSGAVPNTLLSLIRTRSPPTLVQTMLRTVWLVNPPDPAGQVVGLKALTEPDMGLAAHVPTQAGKLWPCWVFCRDVEHATRGTTKAAAAAVATVARSQGCCDAYRAAEASECRTRPGPSPSGALRATAVSPP
jgi:hypothetical protein